MPIVLNGNAGNRQDMVSKFFGRVARHFANEMAVVTPNGEMLSSWPEQGLKKWRELPPEKRKQLDDLGEYNAALDPQPPSGGLVFRVFARAFTRDTEGRLKIYKTNVTRSWEPGRDYLWLDEAEAKSLLQGTIGDRVVLRTCRYCLIDLVRVGGNGGPHRPEHVLSRSMRMVAIDKTHWRIEGSARLASYDGPKREDEYRFSGEANIDAAKGTFNRFDFAALSETGHYDEINRKVLPFGVAFELTPAATPADRIAPASYSESYFK